MSSIPTSFNLMYQSFVLFTEAGKKWSRNFIPLSAGVNWTRASKVVCEMLHRELDSAATYRNYGNAGGIRPVTDVLEKIECDASGIEGLSAQIVNGATEGAWLIFEYLKVNGHIKPGDKTLMIGHGYPLYCLLSEQFHLIFHDCLGCEDGIEEYLPDIDTIQETVERIKPKVVFLLLPNNPLGESYSGIILSKICEITSTNKAFLLIDRACLMPWDDRYFSMQILASEVVAGNAAIVDSLSKSESLAGLRVGFIITNQIIKRTLTKITQARFLNPIVFSTITLAFCRLAEHRINIRDTVARVFRANIDEIFSEYPISENYNSLLEDFELFLANYIPELKIKENRIIRNLAQLRQEFGDLARRPLIFEAGFNCVLSLDTMKSTSEAQDVLNLCEKYGVGVLTERCFRTPGSNSHYFIRIGLSIEEKDFKNALYKVKEYYTK